VTCLLVNAREGACSLARLSSGSARARQAMSLPSFSDVVALSTPRSKLPLQQAQGAKRRSLNKASMGFFG